MSEPDPQDTLLVVRCQLGDAEAWDDLIHRWHRRLWRFVSRMINDRVAAEDVLQTIWLQVVRSILRLREAERFEAWLYGIARRTINDRYRAHYRSPAWEPVGDIADAESLQPLETADAVEAGLSRLHPSDREAVVLHYLEELPIAAVADICGVPMGTIKSRLHRARRIIRESLTEGAEP